MLRPFVAMQHTSNDVFAYVKYRRRMPATRGQSRGWGRGLRRARRCNFLRRTLLSFSSRGGFWRGLELRVGRAKTVKARAESKERWSRIGTEKAALNDGATEDRPDPAQLQPMGSEPDAGRLRAALHGEECAQMVQRS